MDLHDKVALVTGGTKGIGAATAIELARRGADVAIVGRHDDAEARSVRTAIESLGRRCTILIGDMARAEDAAAVVRAAAQQLGAVDILVHCAGGLVPGGLFDVDPPTWYAAFDVHVHAIYYLCRAAVPLMRQRGEGAIVLISSGIDTFSKITFSKAREILQNAGVPIYAIGLMQALREWYDAYGMLGPIARLDFLQADNQLRTFARETGGMAFFPRFYGEFPGIFRSIAQALRNRYYITYQPSNLKRDGKFRKIKVELVNPATNEPLRITDERGKPIKYTIIAKSGYRAPREVE